MEYAPEDPRANPGQAVRYVEPDEKDDLARAPILAEQADAFPQTLEGPAQAEEAVIHAKRIASVKKRLDSSRKAAQAPFQEEMAAATRPYKDAVEGLDGAYKRLVQRVHRYLERRNDPEKKISTDFGAKAFWRGKNTIEIDEDALPDDWWERVPNMDAIEAAVKADQDIPGVTVKKTYNTVIS